MTIAPESGTRSGGGWGYPIRPRIPRPDPTRPDPLDTHLSFLVAALRPIPKRYLSDAPSSSRLDLEC